MALKKILVRWTAVYETVIEVPENATTEDVQDEIVSIQIDVPGSEYQEDTWEIESWKNIPKE